MPDTFAHGNLDLEEISTRNNHARHIIAGFTSAMPTLSEIWHYLDQSLSDALALASEVTHLSAGLRDTRLDRANLLAAIRAALAAHADGEADPLWYLRDELSAPQTTDAASRRRE